MRSLSETFPFGRNQRWTFLFFAAGLFVAYQCATFVLASDFRGLLLIALIFIICGVVLILLRNWRNGVYLFLAWLLFEDLGRKFLGNNMAVYFAKDILALLLYLAFFAAYRRKDPDLQTFRPPFLVALMLLVWYGAVHVFNPSSNSVLFGILGMKLYFYYVPLLLVGYALIRSENELRKFFVVNLGLIVVISVLGIVQSIAGPRFLNPAVMADDIRMLSETYRVSPISGLRSYRPNSVFVSAGRFSDLLILSWIMGFGFSCYLLLRHRRGRLFAFFVLTVLSAACVMCASRGVFMWSLGTTLVGAAGFIWGAPWRYGEALRAFRALQRTALGIGLATVIMLFAYPQEFMSRIAVYSETLNPASPTSELGHRARDYPLANFLAAFDYPLWPYGYGIGTISLGSQYIARLFNVRSAVSGVESGFGCIVVEMGVFGLILWIVLALAITISGWKIVRGLKGSPCFPLAFMILLYAFLLLLPMTFVSINGYQDFILNAYLWLLLGILFRLPKLALSATPTEVVPGVS